jgi:hypothetical protein
LRETRHVSRRVAVALAAAFGLLADGRAILATNRLVEMEITLPNGAVPHVTVHEREGAVIKLASGARYGFVPAISTDGRSAVVSIWDADAKPIRKLGSVTVAVGGAAVKSDTSPPFAVRVTRVLSRT